jgi:pimeloyl-ACP methyl ester carboxylesterase
VAIARSLLVVLAGVLAGCMFLDVKKQQEKLGAACTIKGTARSMQSSDRAVVAVLLRRKEPGEKVAGTWQITSHFVMEHAGRFVFTVREGTGTYTVGAFDNADRDLVLGPDDAFVTDKDVVTCTPGAVIDGFVLNVPDKPDGRGTRLGVAGLQTMALDEQVSSVFGQRIAVGELTSLAEDMFSEEVAESGLWRPFDFLVDGYAGVYFLEAYDPKRVPVLFVHGINGTPASFKYLIEHLDRKRFQAGVYYYPSGLHLATIAEQLNQTIIKLQVRYRVQRFAVVAHSMGGLVSRGFIQRHQQSRSADDIPLYITMSTPWGGHKAAESGVKTAPVVVEVWHDMAPGSEYQRSIFARPLPPETQHHMLFTFQRKSASFGESDDQGVSVASQLALAAQSGAVRVYGFDDTHVGILSNPEASKLVNELLEKSFPR